MHACMRTALWVHATILQACRWGKWCQQHWRPATRVRIPRWASEPWREAGSPDPGLYGPGGHADNSPQPHQLTAPADRCSADARPGTHTGWPGLQGVKQRRLGELTTTSATPTPRFHLACAEVAAPVDPNTQHSIGLPNSIKRLRIHYKCKQSATGRMQDLTIHGHDGDGRQEQEGDLGHHFGLIWGC